MPGDPIWPQHTASLTITHNEHKDVYETVEQALESGTYRRENFPDQKEIDLAISTDSVWTIQWYPNTPVNFHIVSAATFQRAMCLSHETSAAIQKQEGAVNA